MMRAWRRIRAAFRRAMSEVRERLRRRRREGERRQEEARRNGLPRGEEKRPIAQQRRIAAARREERRRREAARDRDQPRPRRLWRTDKKHLHALARENDLKYGVPMNVTAEPARLINHRYCHTSKPSYLHCIEAVNRTIPPQEWQGVYEATHIRKPLHRPMVRSSRGRSPDAEKGANALRTLVNMLKKRTGEFWTTIRKLAEKVWSRLQRIRVIETVKGYFREVPLIELILRPSIVERIRAAALGFREWFAARIVRHCSVYTRIRGLRYTGPPSGWYFWKRRYSICKQYTESCSYPWRASIQYLCNDYLADANPTIAEGMVARLPAVLQSMLEIAGCG